MAYHRIGNNGKKVWGRRGAGIFFTDGKVVLLLRRSEKGDNKGTWSLPGGKIKTGETDIGAAMRETKEECGTMQGKRFGDFVERTGHHYWHTFLFEIGNPFDCTLSDEHDDWDWVPLNKLEQRKLHPALEQNLNRYRSIIAKKFGRDAFSFKEWLDVNRQ